MKISINELKGLETKLGPRVQFTVTFAEDDGEPVDTTYGWTMDMSRKIWIPASRTGWGKYYPMHAPSDKLLERLAGGLIAHEQVDRILGPQVEGVYLGSKGEEIIKLELDV